MKLTLVEKAKRYFLKRMAEGTPIYAFFPGHVKEVENWAKRILEYYPDANKEVILLAVWLHDVGQADGKYEVDHAVLSEKEAKDFLSNNQVSNDLIKRVAYCVRTHRCKDIQPKTIEAKIVAAADSASHMTDINYIIMLKDGVSRQEVLEKLERDYRDTNYLPKELIGEVDRLYQGWKGLLKVFPVHYITDTHSCLYRAGLYEK